jgi:peptide/nickel transport system ATP-binding protein
MSTDILLLKIKNLNIRYNSSDGVIPILNNLSFSVSKGQTLGITGASGSGKSMTALSLMGLAGCLDNIDVTGEILFEDHDLIKLTDRAWAKIRGRRISMIFQQPQAALNPLMKCGNQITEAICIHYPEMDKKSAQTKTNELLKQVGLQDTKRMYNAYPHELSGGQLQRVVIAMAISNEPDIIIADEPTSSLDAGTAADIIKLLKNIQLQSKNTFIIITHDIHLLCRISDQIILIKDGAIEADFENKGFDASDFSAYTKEYFELSLAKNEFRKSNASENSILLEVQSVSKSYATSSFFSLFPALKHHVLHDIHLNLKSGSILGILGASGSGKTTLGKIIAGIIDADKGMLSYKSKAISKLKLSTDKVLRKNIQLIFQDSYSSFNPKQTVGQILREVISFHSLANSHRERDEIIDGLMTQLMLNKNTILDRYPDQLSGGQRQRIAIGRTLLLKPDIIIFDESLSALDQFNQQNIIDLIIQLQNEYGFSGIFISHDPNLVKALCTEVMILDQGKSVEYGPTYQVFSYPQHEVTKSLIDSAYDLK